LRIPAEYVEQLKRFVSASGVNETGGLLFGYYTPGLEEAVVTLVTPAPADSRSGRTWFRRGIDGLQALVRQRWGERREFDLGEWHYHPNAAPTPSGQDVKQMLEIASDSKRRCPEPILLIIGGHPDAWSFSATVFPRGRPAVPLRQV
jgi:integrative and conjugative element protein (TIGR02256 family)